MENFLESSSSPSSLFSSISSTSNMVVNPHPFSIHLKICPMVDQKIQDILSTVRPSGIPDLKRKEVISYLQKLIKDAFGIEVFPFGSLPLKTYLPDGDVDLTALCPPHMEGDMAKNICNMLKAEENGSIFLVKDVQCIPAQVQIVKCTINDIPVDISFNQKAGLSALCFKEKVSEMIGKEQLFKLGVILVKAWCFYESRILGAHQGLISTYAIETLVIYIFNLFHESLSSPFAVLYRFLDYYSSFEWGRYCVSISGPVPISFLPEVLVILESEEGRLLLSQEFLKNCKKSLSSPSKLEERSKEFPLKYLNIVDPLKDINNLGRSVSKGNFHRIICAFSNGAKRLGEILTLRDEEMISAELESFFTNTLDRNGRGIRPDIQTTVSAFGSRRSKASDLSGDYDTYYKNLQLARSSKPIVIKPIPSPFICAKPSTLPISISPRPPTPILCGPSSLPVFAQHSASPPNSGLHSSSWVSNKSSRMKDAKPYIPLRLANPYIPAFHVDERRKSRGTGSFIPEMTYGMYRERMRPKNQQFKKPRDQQHGPRDQQHGRLRNQQQSVRNPGFQGGSSFPPHGFPQHGFLPPSRGVAPPYNFSPLGFSPCSSSSHGISPLGLSPPNFLPNGFSHQGSSSTRGFRPRVYVPKGSQNTHSNRNFETKSYHKRDSAPPTKTTADQNGNLTAKSTNGNYPEFSLEEFPILPVCRKPLASENQAAEPKLKSPQLKEIPFSIQNIAFGTYGSLQSAPTIQKEPEIPESDEKKRSVEDSYNKLIDDTEFPPLGHGV